MRFIAILVLEMQLWATENNYDWWDAKSCVQKVVVLGAGGGGGRGGGGRGGGIKVQYWILVNAIESAIMQFQNGLLLVVVITLIIVMSLLHCCGVLRHAFCDS